MVNTMKEYKENVDNRFERLEAKLTQLIELVDPSNKKEVSDYEQRLQKLESDIRMIKNDVPRMVRRINDIDNEVISLSSV
ncbi:hypothetical protein P364_0113800 [Paenibacillus sp. MAEPY2]|nr:hypothetical protein P364_0113800 [Paenibacillus sp. MAEPY2]KGP84771.1 hypothetical protein P363_0123030 [Paenibacillus sp. MAEPY1]